MGKGIYFFITNKFRVELFLESEKVFGKLC